MNSLESVIEGGFCIGCGTCTYTNKDSQMQWNNRGELIPLFEINDKKESNICPFSDDSKDESNLADIFFDDELHTNNIIGKYSNLYAGQVKRDDILENSSSGGMLTWINKKLLDLNIVDGIIAVKESANDSLFEYEICSKSSDLKFFAKSRYYPAQLGNVLKKIKNDGKKYALVTLPCFAKSVRNLQLVDKELQNSIPFIFTLICGHLKTKNYSEYLGWQSNILPKDLTNIDFRVKDKNQLSSKYSVSVSDSKSNNLISFDDLKYNDWGLGLFKPKACDFCDDVFGELGDLTVGDAWLPEYLNDDSGNSVVIIRNKIIDDIFIKYSSELNIKQLSKEDLFKSQKGGISHKRSGLRVRLDHYSDLSKITPKKRMKLIPEIKKEKDKQKFLKRMQVSEKSHTSFIHAKSKEDFNIFFNEMDPYVQSYYKILRPFYIRVLRYIRDFVR
ncbi:Coenzyme F420 hydrogenase/dehydrogenase, beta subunit C-terminal domain [Gammaproteobacteria bacterium]|nr:Coenzyme F420 hydrogenase/dehydrogenase, beta subunit C-terminal domain [Gammaproteobacteria bacterium]